MDIPLLLLIATATVGAVDGLYFHVFKYRLAAQPSSRWETLTHIARSCSFTVSVLILVRFTPSGGWFSALAALFGLDFLIDVIDVSIEPASRAPLGGLPPLEYLVHTVVMALSGGAWVSYAVLGWSLHKAPTALVERQSALPSLLVADAWLVALGAAGLALLESVLLARSWALSGGTRGQTPPARTAPPT